MNKSRREEQREATLQEIKERAWQQIAEQGSANLSMRQITREMRMSSAAIFRYFENRETLLDALSEDAFQAHTTAMGSSLVAAAGAPPYERLLTLGHAYRQWAIEFPNRYMLIYGTPIAGYKPDWQRLTPSAGRGLTLFLEVFEEGRQQGELFSPVTHLSAELSDSLAQVISERGYPVEPESLYAAITAWTWLHGMVSLEIVGQLGLASGNAELLFRQGLETLMQQMSREA